jgi:hypothetical protein
MKRHECARRLGACIVFGCACALYAVRGYADWEAIPDISLKAETNDNPALHSGEAVQFIDQVNRLLADATLRIRNAEARGELTFEPRVRSDVYAEEEAKGLESTDLYLRSNGVHRGQTVEVGYQADIASERLLGVNFLETLPTDPVSDDTTAIVTSPVGINEERTRFGVLPYVEIAMNSRSTIRLDGWIVDVDYEAGSLAGRSDFLERGIGGEYLRALNSQRGTIGVRLFATGYEADLNANVTDTRGIEVMYERDMSELWSWNVAGGTQRADYAYTSQGRRIRGTDDTPIWAIGVSKRGERSSMRTELQRRLSPDVAGFVAPREEVRVAWTRLMSARVAGRMVLRAIDSEGVEPVSDSDRRYGRLELGLDWQLRPTWSFIASYAYAKSTSDVTIVDPAAPIGTPPVTIRDPEDSNTLTIGIRYHGRSVRPGTFAAP